MLQSCIEQSVAIRLAQHRGAEDASWYSEKNKIYLQKGESNRAIKVRRSQQ